MVSDVISLVCLLQLCKRHDAGCEAAIHAKHIIFEDESTEEVLLVDVAHTFNYLNRKLFLISIYIICPALDTYERNCYIIPPGMFVIGGLKISLSEGTKQVDFTPMKIYAMAIISLVLVIN